MGDAPPPPVSPMKHYCNVTFLSVGDVGPDGLPIERLLRCSRCRETYYCGPEQQRSHWKLHKFVCRSIRDEIIMERRIMSLDMVSLVEIFASFFNEHAWQETAYTDLMVYDLLGRPFLLFFKRLQDLYYNEDGQDVSAAVEMEMWMNALFRVDDQTIELLWAIPGMTTFFLNLELMSTAMRQRKLVAAALSDEELLNSEAHGFAVSGFSAQVAEIFCMFLEASYSRKRTPGQNPPQFRNTAVATCMARKLMQFYADPYTRACLPCDQSSRRNPRNYRLPNALCVLMLAHPDDPLDDTALVPGLTVHDIFQIIVTESAWQERIGIDGYAKAYFKALTLSQASKPKAWDAFSVEARASTAHKLLGLYCRRGSKDDKYSDMDAREYSTHLFLLVIGFNGHTEAKDEKMWLKVVKLASTPEFGPYSWDFAEWYHRVAQRALVDLCDQVKETAFLELMPPFVLDHLLEFAVDPFAPTPHCLFLLPRLFTETITSSQRNSCLGCRGQNKS